MSTVAAITGIKLPEGAASDSYNVLPVLKGEKYDIPAREVLIHNTFESKWAVRKGEWLYINDKSGEHRKMPEFFKELRDYVDFETEGLLFNIEKDPGQRNNLYTEFPEKAKELDRFISVEKAKGYLQKDN